VGLFDGVVRDLTVTAKELREEIADLRAERKAATKELGLTDTVIRLKTEVEDLADLLHELKRLP
jgi:hypothetical protein